MNESGWIATAIAIPSISVLIYLVRASCARQDIITSTFVNHVQTQTSTLVAIKNQITRLSDSRADVKDAIAEQTKFVQNTLAQQATENREEHLKITDALVALKGTFEAMCVKLREPPEGMLSAIATAIQEIERVKANEIIAHSISADSVQAGAVRAEVVEATHIKRPKK